MYDQIDDNNNNNPNNNNNNDVALLCIIYDIDMPLSQREGATGIHEADHTTVHGSVQQAVYIVSSGRAANRCSSSLRIATLRSGHQQRPLVQNAGHRCRRYSIDARAYHTVHMLSKQHCMIWPHVSQRVLTTCCLQTTRSHQIRCQWTTWCTNRCLHGSISRCMG
jgi:hypothetical protein